MMRFFVYIYENLQKNTKKQTTGNGLQNIFNIRK